MLQGFHHRHAGCLFGATPCPRDRGHQARHVGRGGRRNRRFRRVGGRKPAGRRQASTGKRQDLAGPGRQAGTPRRTASGTGTGTAAGGCDLHPVTPRGSRAAGPCPVGTSAADIGGAADTGRGGRPARQRRRSTRAGVQPTAKGIDDGTSAGSWLAQQRKKRTRPARPASDGRGRSAAGSGATRRTAPRQPPPRRLGRARRTGCGHGNRGASQARGDIGAGQSPPGHRRTNPPRWLRTGCQPPSRSQTCPSCRQARRPPKIRLAPLFPSLPAPRPSMAPRHSIRWSTGSSAPAMRSSRR